jgi:hypothetical protein
MSTRGAIARKTSNGKPGEPQTFVGRHHHWDSYPSGLGKALWGLYHGHFQRDLQAMLTVLVDDHPAGWSTICGKDVTKAPGFHEGLGDTTTNPLCYCHGDRSE